MNKYKQILRSRGGDEGSKRAERLSRSSSKEENQLCISIKAQIIDVLL